MEPRTMEPRSNRACWIEAGLIDLCAALMMSYDAAPAALQGDD